MTDRRMAATVAGVIIGIAAGFALVALVSAPGVFAATAALVVAGGSAWALGLR